jgi:hypothetical protein
MPPRETGKQRAARIPLDYFKRPNFLERWKLWLAAIGVIVPLVWLGSGMLRGDRGTMRYARGPVAAVHATWEDQCAACHMDFTPLSKETWSGALLGHTATNQRCQVCHVGPPHHEGQTPDLACADCHREHRGRDASLVRLADADCTQCHADLSGHLSAGRATEFKNIQAFAEGSHPPFRSLDSKDPGTIHFNHKLHMTAGLGTAEAGNPGWTLSRIPTAQRARYQQPGQKDSDLVQLDCASCHRTENGDPGSSGAYMAPIRYETHCQACHPLTFAPRRGDKAGSLVAIPHGLQPEQVRNVLWGAYASELADAKLPGPTRPVRPLPGQDPEEARKEIARQVGQAEDFLYQDKVQAAARLLLEGKQTCGECHQYEKAEGTLKKIKPSAIPKLWLKHARFNHAAHAAIDCKQCHERAYPDQARASTRSEDILVPGMDRCVICHAPQTHTGGEVRGGARSDCTECHRYHQRGFPESRKTLNFGQFLSGKSD